MLKNDRAWVIDSAQIILYQGPSSQWWKSTFVYPLKIKDCKLENNFLDDFFPANLHSSWILHSFPGFYHDSPPKKKHIVQGRDVPIHPKNPRCTEREIYKAKVEDRVISRFML